MHLKQSDLYRVYGALGWKAVEALIKLAFFVDGDINIQILLKLKVRTELHQKWDLDVSQF